MATIKKLSIGGQVHEIASAVVEKGTSNLLTVSSNESGAVTTYTVNVDETALEQKIQATAPAGVTATELVDGVTTKEEGGKIATNLTLTVDKSGTKNKVKLVNGNGGTISEVELDTVEANLIKNATFNKATQKLTFTLVGTSGEQEIDLSDVVVPADIEVGAGLTREEINDGKGIRISAQAVTSNGAVAVAGKTATASTGGVITAEKVAEALTAVLALVPEAYAGPSVSGDTVVFP